MYSFYFEQGGEEIQLPVPPSNLSLKINNKNKTVDLLNLGEVNILKDAGLSEWSFAILLPGRLYPFAVYKQSFLEPRFYLDRFERYKISKKPVRFIISRLAPWGEPLFDTNMMVSLESYTIEENAGEEGDIYVSLELKQYKEYLTQKVELAIVTGNTSTIDNIVTATVEPERAVKEIPKTYTVKESDSLWLIAKKQLNDGSRYSEIAKLNNLKNPNLLKPGQVLQLP